MLWDALLASFVKRISFIISEKVLKNIWTLNLFQKVQEQTAFCTDTKFLHEIELWTLKIFEKNC